jgi:glycosyltransferase involved in cell wall biosynthesis
VIDQNSEGVDGLSEVRSEFETRCTWVHSSLKNLPAARNLGARLAQGSILIYCDDDIEAPPTYLENILARYADDKWGAVCGPAISSDASWNSLPPVADLQSDEAFWRCNFQSAVSMEVRSGMGCNHTMRKHWWSRAGGYDESFAGGALREESEFFVRLVRSGCRVYYDAACWVYHPRGNRTGGCAGQFGMADVRETFRQRLQSHAYFLYKSFPNRANRHMLSELLSLFIRRHGLNSLFSEPRIAVDWYKINRETARRFRQPLAAGSPRHS